MEEISHSCCILAHTNSKYGGKIPNGIYIYLTHSYTQTQYQVVEYFSLPLTVLWAQKNSLKHSCASAGSHSLTSQNFSLSLKLGGPKVVLKKCPTPPAHRIVKYQTI